MPPLPKLHIRALDELARQLRFAPAEALRRQLVRVEALAGEIDGAVAYPEDWIVFRVTGYRPEIREPAMFSGDALLADVSALVERLSAAAGITEAELEPGRYLDAGAVCERWKVSRKTLDRYRRLGLISRRVKGANGKPKLMLPLEAVERFERRERARLEGAAGFTRIEPALEERMLRRAAAYRDFGCSLNQAAARIAARYGRAHETVRQLLRRHDKTAAEPIFAERGPPTARERRLIERSWLYAIEPTAVARRLGRSPPAVHRVINDARAERLRALLADGLGEDLGGGALSSKYLLAEPVISGLGEPGETDLLRLIRGAREGGVPLGVVERARAAAYHFLRARARAAIGELPAHGATAAAVDGVETDLRWAMRLKVELVRSQLPLMVRTLESSLGRSLEEVRSAVLGPLVLEAIGAIAEAVDAFDAGKGGRLASPAGMALTRVAVRFVREQGAEAAGGVGRARAVGRLAEGVVIADWTRRVCAWQELSGRVWLEARAGVREGMAGLDERLRVVLASRYGWGAAPVTVAALAERLGTTVMAAGRLERRAVRGALEAGRGSR